MSDSANLHIAASLVICGLISGVFKCLILNYTLFRTPKMRPITYFVILDQVGKNVKPFASRFNVCRIRSREVRS